MKRLKISRRAETRPYGRVSAPTGNCRKFLTQLSNFARTTANSPGALRCLRILRKSLALASMPALHHAHDHMVAPSVLHQIPKST